MSTRPAPLVPSAPPVGAVRFGQSVQRSLQRLVHKMAPPQFTIMGIVSDRWRADALAALVRLGVPDALGDASRTAEELAEELQLNAPALYRVLRALARDGLVEERQRRFSLNALSHPLRRDHPASMANMVMELAAPRNAACWSQLAQSVRTGQTAWGSLYDVDMWAWLDQHPDEHAIFHGAMLELTREGAPSYARAYPFGEHTSVVDLGGGTGLLLATILAVHPNLRGVLIDAPSVVAGAPAVLQRYGVEDRCAIVGADIFTSPVPAGHGAYIAKNISHGVSDDGLRGPLERWRAAMVPTSRLVLIDVVVPEGDAPYLGFLDLQMLLVSHGGKERTEAEFGALLGANGLALERVIPTASPMSMVVARRT